MLHNIQIENAFNCVLKRSFIAAGPFSRNKSYFLDESEQEIWIWRVWKFCLELSNVISGGNWLFK